jgi:hypothetical protein
VQAEVDGLSKHLAAQEAQQAAGAGALERAHAVRADTQARLDTAKDLLATATAQVEALTAVRSLAPDMSLACRVHWGTQSHEELTSCICLPHLQTAAQ